MIEFFNSQNEIVKLGAEIGRGGEGAVYEIVGDAESAAKIYHEAISADKTEKLRQMVALKSEKLLKLAAWTTDILLDKTGKTVGFVMPRINSGKAIHELYTPKSRRRLFPAADWRFLIRAAANLARSFVVIHAHNHAVGDVNHGNVVIARDATVKLIDCDSYHLNAPEKQFPCEVGVATHTPPELQNHSLRDVVRTANHDNFGLAVLIFQLLFMGRHPFSGAFLGEGENSLENSIAAGRFAYGDGARKREMRQPPGTLAFSAIPEKVGELFERAFLQIENRPSARDWVDALTALEANLRQCGANTAHYFWQDLPKCPWCRLEGETGVLFFPANWTGDFSADGEFDLPTLGRLIDAIKPPELPETLPLTKNNTLQNYSSASAKLPLSPKIEAALTGYRQQFVLFLIGLGITIFWLTSFPAAFGFCWVVPGFWICSVILNSLTKKVREATNFQLDAARQSWQNFGDKANKKALLKPFEDARAKLKIAVERYRELPKLKQTKLENYEQERYQTQLEMYLNRFYIKDAKNLDLNESRLNALHSNQIRTALNIDSKTFGQISSFSPAHKQKLLGWRVKLEKNFVYKPLSKFEKERCEEIEEEFAVDKRRIEAELKNGFPRLQQFVVQIKKNAGDLESQAAALFAALEKAENDGRAIANLRQRAIAWTIFVAVASFAVGIPIRYSFYSPPIPQPPSRVYYNDDYKTKPGTVAAPKPSGDTVAVGDENESLEKWGEAGDFYKMGERYFAAGKYNEAAIAYQNAARANPKIATIFNKLGETYFQLAQYNKAVEAYQNALKIKSDSDTYHKLGLAYEKLNRTDDAVSVYKKAIEANPNAMMSFYELGKTLRKSSKAASASDYLVAAIRLENNFADAHYELGLCYLDLGYKGLAEKELNNLFTLESPLAAKLTEEIDKNHSPEKMVIARPARLPEPTRQ